MEERRRKLAEYSAEIEPKIKEARRLKSLIVDDITRKAFFDYMAANGIGEGFGMSEKE
jgi:hypothetical protein